MRGQIFKFFIACHVAAIIFSVYIPWVGFVGWLQRSASIPCYKKPLQVVHHIGFWGVGFFLWPAVKVIIEL